MKAKEKLKKFCKEFKELKKGKKVLFFILVLTVICLLVVMVTYCIGAYRLLKNTERWTRVLLGILGLYEFPLLYQFTKRMSAKEKELKGIMRTDMSVKNNMEALHNYDFVTVPEIIFGAFSEKSSTIILLFVNYFLLLVSDTNAQDLFHIYSFFLGVCLSCEGFFKLIYLMLTKTCVIFIDINICRDRKIQSLLKKKSELENLNVKNHKDISN